MGFKSDREFLRNVSIGAVSTRQVAAVLTRGGFNIIELERYSGSNKIWATKIKRLRVPDLLCLKTGTRIEARGKSKLVATMSHAVNDPERAWDKALRDRDLIAFNFLSPDGDGWKASNQVSLYHVGDLRATQHLAKLSQRKSAAEGSEVSLTWPAVVPGKAGTVTEVSAERISTLISSTGRKQSYSLQRKTGPKMIAHLKEGDAFGEGDTIIASMMPALVAPTLPKANQYDFLADLESNEKETVYIAVKALGFLPQFLPKCGERLVQLKESHADGRVRLEAAASLARLGLDEGWRYLASLAGDLNGEPEYRMETALILAEQPNRQAIDLLSELAETKSNRPEIRAAGAWGLASHTAGVDKLIPLIADTDELTAVHAIVATSKVVNERNIGSILRRLGEDDRQSAGLARAILDCDSHVDFVQETVDQILTAPLGNRRQWLLYVLAAASREKCERVLKKSCPQLISELEFYWTHHGDNWTNRLDATDQINFLEQQTLRPL